MSRHQDDAPPTWFRLSETSWAGIGEEYRNGATAKALAAKWRVSPTSIYRHACKDGWTKKTHGDAVARAHVTAIENRGPGQGRAHAGSPAALHGSG